MNIFREKLIKTMFIWDSSGAGVVKNPLCNAGEAGSVLGQRIKIPRDPVSHN